jgi:single-strand DNA-binding protein
MGKAVGGKAVCEFTLAVEDLRAKGDRADFFRVRVSSKLASLCEKYLRKGFLVGVTGYLRCETYTDAEGVERYPVTVIAEHIQFLQWPEQEYPERSEE